MDEDADGELAEADKYLPPVEVESQMKLLWFHQAELLDFIWGRALNGGEISFIRDSNRSRSVVYLHVSHLWSYFYIGIFGKQTQLGNEGEIWRLFFMRVIAVPPSRFRPASIVGQVTSEHSANVHLKAIIEGNEKIQLMLREAAQKKLEEKGDDADNEFPDTLDAAILVAQSQYTGISKQVSLWIELQNAVNCYMDSSKVCLLN